MTSLTDLREALRIAEEIVRLQARYQVVLGELAASASEAPTRIIRSVVAQARGVAGAPGVAAPASGAAQAAKMPLRGRKGISAEGRARLAAAMKARWEKARRTGAPPPTAARRRRRK